MSNCTICPRACGADRESGMLGFCHAPSDFLVARSSLHLWEEPPISGKRGSGTVFFGGCNLGCVFCQNKAINQGQKGERLSEKQLEAVIFRLAEQGAHNINFVTPSHYAIPLAHLLERIKPMLPIPTVYNCGGYESIEALHALDGLIDIYLPDLKYHASALAARYSSAPDYPKVALAAITEMYRQRGSCRFGQDGLLKSGVIVRHLVLPHCRADSAAVLDDLASTLPVHDIRLSLMSQYTPDFTDKEAYPELSRRVTSFEYDFVMKKALSLGFEGYFQARSSASADYTPDF